MRPLDRLRDSIQFDQDRGDQDQDRGDQDPERDRRRRFRFAGGLVLALLLFAAPLYWNLGGFDLDNDEAIYSHAVLSIVQEGAWASPWSSPGHGPFLEKPPLKLWLVALGMLAGLPRNELGLRFFDPLFGALAFFYLYALGFRAGGPWAGLGAVATLFLFEPLIFEHGLRANTMEAALLLAYCGGAWHFLAWTRAAPAGRRRQLLAATLFFTLGFLVKFVAALFLPLVAGLATLLHPELRGRLRREWPLLLAAGGLFALLAAPWFLYQHRENGALFWKIIFGQHVVERFTHHLDPAHLHPFGYYFAAIWRELAVAGTWPWVVAGLLLWLAASWRGRSAFGLFVVLWAVVPLVAISFGTSKLIHYTYPFLPPLGLFAGFALSRLLAAARQLPRDAGIAVLLFAIALGAFLSAPHYRQMPAKLASSERPLHQLATCLGRGNARTLVDEGEQRPLVFVHAFLTSGIYHPLAFYSRQAAEMQQLDTPDDRLLFFRLYLPPHQAASVVPALMWQEFREKLGDPDFRQSVLDEGRELGAEAQTARLLEDPGALPEPPGFVVADTHYFLPGPYAVCAPRQPAAVLKNSPPDS